jgi:site-specific DNA-methyltransferase (adenine-specific)
MKTNTAYAWWEGRNYLGDFKVQLPDKENYYKLKKLLELDNRFDYLIEWQEAEREVIGTTITNKTVYQNIGGKNISGKINITEPSTDLAKQWQGWGTALKPSFEPIIVARKPFKGSLVDNIIEYGVGGINIDECRVGNEVIKGGTMPKMNSQSDGINLYNFGKHNAERLERPDSTGRFPANTILTYDETDFDEVCGGFPYTKSGGGDKSTKCGNTFLGTGYGGTNTTKYEANEGSASRYFYCAKASAKDRNEGLDVEIEEYVLKEDTPDYIRKKIEEIYAS